MITDGNSAESILEKAKKLGKSTGLVSDTRITHATPSGFAAHQSHRSLENEIAVDLLNNNVDVMLSGGLRYWIPESANDEQSAARQGLEALSEGSVRIKSKRKDNPFYIEGHKYLSAKTVPKMDVNGAFFVYQTDDNRQNLLAREVAEQQNVVWATGTHTNTPVLVFTQGPGGTTARFGKVLHHTTTTN